MNGSKPHALSGSSHRIINPRLDSILLSRLREEQRARFYLLDTPWIQNADDEEAVAVQRRHRVRNHRGFADDLHTGLGDQPFEQSALAGSGAGHDPPDGVAG